MNLVPIFASLRRNPLGPVLIVSQVALTLAILLNVAGIVRQHVERMRSPSGLDEANVFSLANLWIGQPSAAPALVARDLAVLRATPGVVAAVSTNGVPLSGRGGWGTPIDTKPVDLSRQGILTEVELYYLDEQGADALGLRIVQGRWFTADEVAGAGQVGAPGLVVLTRALADHLFPRGDALGQVVYMGARADTIIGIVENLQIASPGNPSVALENTQFSAIMGSRLAMNAVNNYVVRTKPGAQQSAMKEAERRLRQANAQRVITQLLPFKETRHNSYRANRALTAILVAVNLLLVAVTALGIAGLASYWVAQRQRMIGVRRALGAKRLDILSYFHIENLLIVGIGTLLGIGLAFALNTLLAKSGVPRIEQVYLWGGMTAVLVIGQLAVLSPALRAARVSPALATRSG